MAIPGERLLARGDSGDVRLFGPTGAPLAPAAARKRQAVADAVRLLPAASLLVDGVLAAVAPDGHADPKALARTLAGEGPAVLTYYLFDLPYLDGHDLRGVPLARRKALLDALIRKVAERTCLRYLDHVEGAGADFFREACRLGIPGMTSRRRRFSLRRARRLAHRRLRRGARLRAAARRSAVGLDLVPVDDVEARRIGPAVIGAEVERARQPLERAGRKARWSDRPRVRAPAATAARMALTAVVGVRLGGVRVLTVGGAVGIDEAARARIGGARVEPGRQQRPLDVAPGALQEPRRQIGGRREQEDVARARLARRARRPRRAPGRRPEIGRRQRRRDQLQPVGAVRHEHHLRCRLLDRRDHRRERRRRPADSSRPPRPGRLPRRRRP